MEAKVKLRKWGSSIGIVIPSEIIKKRNLREGEEIVVDVKEKKNPLKEAFGSLKDWKIDAQKVKNENRKEWY